MLYVPHESERGGFWLGVFNLLRWVKPFGDRSGRQRQCCDGLGGKRILGGYSSSKPSCHCRSVSDEIWGTGSRGVRRCVCREDKPDGRSRREFCAGQPEL